MKRTMRKIETINQGIPGNPIHAYITRGLLERLAPFSLFDDFNGRVPHDQPGGWHPHSGIATVTYVLRGGLTHRDTNGASGLIPTGGIQWMSAGKGLWHDGAFQVRDSGGIARDLQLWIQLPPELEMGDDYAHAIAGSEEIVQVGNTKVLLGEYQGVRSAISHPVDVIYLRVSLQAGESWSFEPDEKYSRGFVFPFEGEGVRIEDVSLTKGFMGILEDSSGLIRVEAENGAVEFVIALAQPPAHPIVAKHGSIHTTKERLDESMHVIAQLGKTIRSEAGAV